MKRELDYSTEAAQSRLTDSSPPLHTTRTSTGPELNGSVHEHSADRPHETSRVRSSVQSNGFIVYTRNKKLKSSGNGVHSDSGLVNIGEAKGEYGTKVEVTSVNGVNSGGNSVGIRESNGEYEPKAEVTSVNGTMKKHSEDAVQVDRVLIADDSEGVSVMEQCEGNGDVTKKSRIKVNVKLSSANDSMASKIEEALHDVDIINSDNFEGLSAMELCEDNGDVTNKWSGETVNVNGLEGNFVNIENGEGIGKSVMVEVEVKEQPMASEIGSNASRRFMQSALMLKVENIDTENEDGVGVKDAVVTEAEEEEIVMGTPTKKLELKMSKKIEIKGRPTTVLELFETGLLEGYPVFYNGGKKGIVLRGTIKDIGILCFCNFCQGAKVIPPSQFEIHAIKTYKRASQYICLENGKSLLDVVKECSKSSLKALEGTIRSFIGPMPAQETLVCRNCKQPFLATFAATTDQVCDACVIHIRRETNAIRTWRETNPINATYIKASVASFKASESAAGVESSASADVNITPKRNKRGRKKKKSIESALNGKSPGRSSVRILSRTKSLLKITNKLQEPALVLKETGSVLAHKSVKNDLPGKISNRSSISVAAPNFSRNASACVSGLSKAQWKITKKDQRMHKLVFEEGGLPDGTEVAYYSRGKKLLEGYKKGGGIFCFCCSSEVSPSQFEAHAGWASRRKPYGYIYTSNGVSLHEFAISLRKGRKYTAKDNDDLCIICADGGKLVLCDGCPRAFHRECASLLSIPRGKWYCTYCENKFQREKHVEHSANALAAGRIPGVDPIEEITQRCIRTVRNPEEAEVIACVICRAYDFSKSGFGPRTVILCDQCEKEYHVGCLKKSKVADLKELPKGKWFCSMDCKRIYSALQNLLSSGAEKLPNSCLDLIKKKHQDKGLATNTDLDIRWRVLSGKVTSRETRLLLSEAVAIFHDCFDPIVDSATGRDFIPSMVYGRNIRGQDFSGMYCAILTVNSSVVSAGIFRIFGQDMAELPLVATRMCNQGKGYFQLLFSCIEKLLAFLNVRSSVLPAADEAEAIWTKKFGYNKIPPDQLIDYRKTCWQMITFKGTSMLEKNVPKCRIIRPSDPDSVGLVQ